MNNLQILENIAVPKGSNRQLAEGWLSSAGYSPPDFAGNCLHRN